MFYYQGVKCFILVFVKLCETIKIGSENPRISSLILFLGTTTIKRLSVLFIESLFVLC